MANPEFQESSGSQVALLSSHILIITSSTCCDTRDREIKNTNDKQLSPFKTRIMESDGFLNSDDRSYGTASTSMSASPLTMRPMGSSTLSLNSLVLPPNPLLLPLNQHENHYGNNRLPVDSFSASSITSFHASHVNGRDSESSSSDSSNGGHVDIDAARIYHAVESAGLQAFGIVAVDVWLLDHGRFVHTEGGLWVSPIFRKRHPSHALDRILEPSHPDYVPPVPQVPGAGLAGYFWALGVDQSYQKLIWRDLHAITSDPFQPPYKRMRVLEEAGFGKATGVPFDVMGHRGVVIYMAREAASEALLNEGTNVDYLKFAAQHIGAASAMSRPRQKCSHTKKQRVARTYQRVVKKMDCVCAFVSLRRSLSSSRSLRDFAAIQKAPSLSTMRRAGSFHALHGIVVDVGEQIDTGRQKLTKWIKGVGSVMKERVDSSLEKAQGSNLSPPPAAPLSNAVWTFVGTFLTLLLLFSFATMVQYETGDTMVLAPFGALLTLQFSLTAAPASQPRNVIYGQLTAIAIALLSKRYLLEQRGWPHWLVVPLATAGGISLMSKLGCTHPPAAAAIVALFARPDFTIFTGAFLMMANILAIFMAILINNLSEKRQYPVYWQFGFVSSLRSLCRQLFQLFPRWTMKRKPVEDPLDYQEYITFKTRLPNRSALLHDDQDPDKSIRGHV